MLTENNEKSPPSWLALYIFINEKVWKQFVESANEIANGARQEHDFKSVDEIHTDDPQTDLRLALEIQDNKWENLTSDSYDMVFSIAATKGNYIVNRQRPLKLNSLGMALTL